MRPLLIIALLAVLVLPTTSAARSSAANDGTLSVRGARGIVAIQARGAVIGSLAQGRVTISDPVDGDGSGPIVTGDDFPPIERSETTTTWRGTNVRFRIIGGRFAIRLQGRGINLSLVGKGNVTLDGRGAIDDGLADDGMYSANGADYLAIPDFALVFPLSATTP